MMDGNNKIASFSRVPIPREVSPAVCFFYAGLPSFMESVGVDFANKNVRHVPQDAGVKWSFLFFYQIA